MAQRRPCAELGSASSSYVFDRRRPSLTKDRATTISTIADPALQALSRKPNRGEKLKPLKPPAAGTNLQTTRTNRGAKPGAKPKHSPGPPRRSSLFTTTKFDETAAMTAGFTSPGFDPTKSTLPYQACSPSPERGHHVVSLPADRPLQGSPQFSWGEARVVWDRPSGLRREQLEERCSPPPLHELHERRSEPREKNFVERMTELTASPPEITVAETGAAACWGKLKSVVDGARVMSKFFDRGGERGIVFGQTGSPLVVGEGAGPRADVSPPATQYYVPAEEPKPDTPSLPPKTPDNVRLMAKGPTGEVLANLISGLDSLDKKLRGEEQEMAGGKPAAGLPGASAACNSLQQPAAEEPAADSAAEGVSTESSADGGPVTTDDTAGGSGTGLPVAPSIEGDTPPDYGLLARLSEAVRSKCDPEFLLDCDDRSTAPASTPTESVPSPTEPCQDPTDHHAGTFRLVPASEMGLVGQRQPFEKTSSGATTSVVTVGSLLRERLSNGFASSEAEASSELKSLHQQTEEENSKNFAGQYSPHSPGMLISAPAEKSSPPRPPAAQAPHPADKPPLPPALTTTSERFSSPAAIGGASRPSPPSKKARRNKSLAAYQTQVRAAGMAALAVSDMQKRVEDDYASGGHPSSALNVLNNFLDFVVGTGMTLTELYEKHLDENASGRGRGFCWWRESCLREDFGKSFF